MKKYVLAVGFVILSMVAHGAVATSFEEGVHYHELSTNEKEEPVIAEFFSFYCVSCYHHQTFNDRVQAEWPDILVKHHVSTFTPRGFETTMQRAWAAAILLEVDTAFAEQVFAHNFKQGNQRNQISSMDTLYEIFSGLGIERAEVDRIMAGFQVRSLVRRMQVEEERYSVSGTPTYIVKGRYRMDPRAFRNSEDFFNDYLELARYLLKK